METLSCIATRHSTRNFKPDMVPESLLEQVIEAGRLAPSGKRMNQNHFLVVRSPEVLEKLTLLVREEFAKMELTPETEENIIGAIKRAKKGDYVFRYNAPVLIIVANKKNYGNNMADAACAMENMMLAACAMGVGSCWVNQPFHLRDNEEMKALLAQLGVGEEEFPCCSLALGLPAGELFPGRPERTGNAVTWVTGE